MHNSEGPQIKLFIPDETDAGDALARCTHLGIGAHQDDLEFMAFHGIAECYDSDEDWFGGITCTNGAGSARSGPYANFSDAEMAAVRIEEQEAAARIGRYSFVAQLGHTSAEIKDGAGFDVLVETCSNWYRPSHVQERVLGWAKHLVHFAHVIA